VDADLRKDGLNTASIFSTMNTRIEQFAMSGDFPRRDDDDNQYKHLLDSPQRLEAKRACFAVAASVGYRWCRVGKSRGV